MLGLLHTNLPTKDIAMNAKKSTKSYRPTANPELAAAMRELRRSSATSKHDTRPRRQRSRQDSKRAAIRAYS